MTTQTDAKETLIHFMKPGTVVYTRVASVARSGLSRRLHFYVVHEARIINLTRDVQIFFGHKPTDSGMKIKGCGMDMGAHVVEQIGKRLWPDTDHKLNHQWL